MYSTCIFCNRALGTNTSLEAFPVGRRLAFDAAKGRLWVVCPHCARWNLTPLEERWEAIEHGERIFRGTRLRSSTEHIGLARLQDGLELIRIGSPLRPEFAAWRYGAHFRGRRRKFVLWTVGATVGVGAALTTGVLTGAAALATIAQGGTVYNIWRNARTSVRIPRESGPAIRLTMRQASEARAVRSDRGWRIQVYSTAGVPMVWHFADEEAERVGALLMPRLNPTGASRGRVQDAVREIERVGDATNYVNRIVERPPPTHWTIVERESQEGFALLGLPPVHRLAFEMALHEEQERRALEGELKGLELAWRAAEEIAAISDDLLTPAAVRARLSSARDE